MRRRTRSSTAVLATLLLTGSLLGAAAAATAPAPSAASSAGDVIARTGELTNRPGPPATANPALQLAAASVRQDLLAGTQSATVVLAAAPPATEAEHYEHGKLQVGFGNLDGGTCVGDDHYGTASTSLAGDLTGSGFSRSGATYVLSRGAGVGAHSPYDCAYVAVLDADGNITDGLYGPLTDTLGQPTLNISRVSLLGSARAPLKLARGVWTTLEVSVSNAGDADAGKVAITGSGKGLKVKAASADVTRTIESTSKIRVKLRGKRKRTTLRLRVAGGGAVATKKVKVSRFRPVAPVAGTYRGKRGTVKFKVRKRAVAGFRADVQVACGTYPQYTYSTMTVRFPRSRIGRDGIVDRTVEKRTQVLGLRLRISGRKVTSGSIYYSTPDASSYCHGSLAFSARRAGR
jgi:hypothetical protein